jgi:hypothetical protein
MGLIPGSAGAHRKREVYEKSTSLSVCLAKERSEYKI